MGKGFYIIQIQTSETLSVKVCGPILEKLGIPFIRIFKVSSGLWVWVDGTRVGEIRGIVFWIYCCFQEDS